MASPNSFRHFSLKDRALAFLSQRLGNRVYTVRHGLIQGMKKKGGLGWIPLAGAQAQTPETRFFQNLDLDGQVVYDVGGFEGVLTLFFSRRAARVVTYEANPLNAQRIRENLALNHVDNVLLREVGVGDREGELTLTYDPRMPGAGSGDTALREQFERSVPGARSFQVAVVPLDLDIQRQGLPPPDFVKIDVEGMELSVLKGLTATLSSRKTRLYLEMHGANIAEKDRKVIEIVEFLEHLGYGSLYHVESGQAVGSRNATAARQGHLFCQ